MSGDDATPPGGADTGTGIGLVDTHCHLDHHFHLDVDEQVARARGAGVTLLVTVGTDVATSRDALATAERVAGVVAAVGIHPNDADTASPEALAEIDRLAAHPAVVAIGETGLDHYRDHTTPAVQEASFRAHIEMAKRHDLALVVHCRDAWEECLAVLADAGAPERVVMHCFSGDAAITERCVAAGHYLSFAGNVTFTNAGALREVAALVPDDLLLTETDAPYLTPHPHRGQANDPSFVGLTLATLAAVRATTPERLVPIVHANARRAFALDRMAAPPRVG
jgi:TatD DNase family protein